MTEFQTASTLSPSQVRAGMRVLDSLDRVDQRLADFYDRQRKQKRQAFRGIVSVLIPATTPGLPPWKTEALSRDVSAKGMSIIYPGPLEVTKVTIGLTLGEGQPAWFRAEIVRGRQVLEGFWEYGVAFRERLASPPGPSVSTPKPQ